MDWNDGTYTLISWKTEFPSHADGEVHKDYGDTYSADGTFLRETFYVVEKFTLRESAVSHDFHKTNVHVHGDC